MRPARKRGMRLALAVVLAVSLTAVFAAAAFASDATDVTITAGDLTISNPAVGQFDAVLLDGHATSTTATVAPFTVTDATGSGAGWKVNVTATQFKEWVEGDYKENGRTIPQGSLTLGHPTVEADGTTSAAPSITAGSYVIDTANGQGDPIAVTIASAAVNQGMGEYDFSQASETPLSLSLPAASTYAADYHSTVTFDAITGP